MSVLSGRTYQFNHSDRSSLIEKIRSARRDENIIRR